MSHSCASCGGPASKKCSGCLKVYYCGIDCQKTHRAVHKSKCYKTVPFTGKCARCLEISPKAIECKVLHPVHCVHDKGSQHSFVKGGMKATYHQLCDACRRKFDRVEQAGQPTCFEPLNSEFCFVGAHCSSLIPSDLRRVMPDALYLPAQK